MACNESFGISASDFSCHSATSVCHGSIQIALCTGHVYSKRFALRLWVWLAILANSNTAIGKHGQCGVN